MDEVQSWWEVPAVAHFCYVFRSAFNLFYIEIGELEAAILNIQDPEMCISLEQLVTRLLQGCFDEDEVTIYNWEEKLRELFSENCEEGENPLENTVFSALSPRSKVEVLLKLCEFRLDADGALEAIKEIPSEDMQARCVGKDGQNNLYWYFCDERLYKEDLSIPVGKTKKQQQPVKGKTAKAAVQNGKKTRERKSKTEDTKKSWSIVCHNSSDWEALIKSFSKSKHKLEKELIKVIKDKYLPMLTEVVAEKDRLLRKRFLELAPKRVSSRISKVQAQKKMEEQMVAEAAERERLEMEEERAKREANKKKREAEERKKRAEAREKIVQDRLQRAQHRERMRGMDDSDSDSIETCTRTSRSRRVSAIKQTSNDSSESEEEEEDEEQEACDNNIASHSESEIEQSAEEHSSKSESEDSGSEESDNCTSVRKESPNLSVRNSISHHKIEQNTFTRPSVIQNSYNLTKWNSEVDSKGHKIHILRCSYDGLPSNKRLKTDESDYKIGRVNPIPTNEMRPTYYNASHTYNPFRQMNLNSCTKVTSNPPIIRIDFIKPAPKPEVSRE